MNYPEFLTRFGGAVRTKNFNPPFDLSADKTAANRRVHYPAPAPEIPPEFIRLDPWEAEYLFMVAARARHGIVETGRFNGGSVFLMACANPDVPIHSVDIAPQNDERLLSLIRDTGIGGHIDLITGDSQNCKYAQIDAFDVLFIDGDHSYDGCTRDMENWYADLLPGGHMVLHDSYHGCPVMDACIDFMNRHDVIAHLSPWKHNNHSTHPAGSMMHFQKPRPKA